MSDYKLDKPVSSNESGVLAKLWRKILKENNFMPALDLLVKRYLDTNDILKGRNKNHKNKTRSTIIANIAATEMTFKTFLDLVFNLLRAKRLDISIKVTMQSGKTSTHSISLTNDDMAKLPEDDTGDKIYGRKEERVDGEPRPSEA